MTMQKKIRINTFSLRYDPKEDRMKLLLNKNGDTPIRFLITRRFYLSLLFELETYMEQLDIPYKELENNKQEKKKQEEKKVDRKISKQYSNISSTLLENLNIQFLKERNKFKFLFQSDTIEAESILGVEQFIQFYTVLKQSFPKGEWGMI